MLYRGLSLLSAPLTGHAATPIKASTFSSQLTQYCLAWAPTSFQDVLEDFPLVSESYLMYLTLEEAFIKRVNTNTHDNI